MYYYSVYGLTLASNIEIPALVPYQPSPLHESDVDVEIVYDETIADFDQYHCEHLIYAHLTMEHCVMFDRRYGLFIVDEGCRVRIQPSEARNLETIQRCITGNVLGVLLYQRGILSLHGSVMAIGDEVVGVVAPSGTGKSSTAAALYARGHRFLSDDAIPMFSQNGQYYVHPGYPRLKISDTVAEFLKYQEADIIARHPDCGEISFDARSRFVQEPLPLKHIYVLLPGDALALTACSQKDALFAIMHNSLPTMWLQPQTPEQFIRSTSLAQKVPFYNLTRSQDLNDLPKLVEMIEAHCADPLNLDFASLVKTYA